MDGAHPGREQPGIEADVIGQVRPDPRLQGLRGLGAAVRQGPALHEHGRLTDARARRLGGQHDLPVHERVPARAITSNSYIAGWDLPDLRERQPERDFDVMFDGNYDASNRVRTANQYFDTSNFSNPAYGEFGTGPGRFEEVRGSGGADEDLGLMKHFTVGSRCGRSSGSS